MRVEIWSDVVCPWCYVGTRRFEQALERLAEEPGPDGGPPEGADDIEVVHRAFELDPTVPADGPLLAEYLARKFGGTGAVANAHHRLDRVASDLDIEFRWEDKRRVNTFDAHRLTAWALDVAGPRTQHALHQRLFRAYFTENLDVADHGVLAGLAGEVGLDVDQAAEVLATSGYADVVRAEERQASELDIHAVPTFLIEGRWAIPGAQDVDTLVSLLRRARERLAPLAAPLTAAVPSPAAPTPAQDAGDCDDGACAVESA